MKEFVLSLPPEIQEKYGKRLKKHILMMTNEIRQELQNTFVELSKRERMEEKCALLDAALAAHPELSDGSRIGPKPPAVSEEEGRREIEAAARDVIQQLRSRLEQLEQQNASLQGRLTDAMSDDAGHQRALVADADHFSEALRAAEKWAAREQR